MEQEANVRLHELLVDQARFLRGYFSGEPLDSLTPGSVNTLPLLDYLYDKQLQLDTDVWSVLQQQEQAHVSVATSVRTDRFLGYLDGVLSDTHHAGSLSDVHMKNLRTLYRFRLDNQLQDHTDHYAQSFLPFYRFSRHRNFSQAVGSTMKRNIRALYDYVRKVVGDPAVCPCIILFNLFIRDSFRLFSLLSMQHYNYVRVVDDWSGRETIVSYVELTNIFPQISQWFPNINGQYVKKHGPHSFQKLDAHVSLLMQDTVGGAVTEHTPRLPPPQQQPEQKQSNVVAAPTVVQRQHQGRPRARQAQAKRRAIAASSPTSVTGPSVHRRTHLEQLFSHRKQQQQTGHEHEFLLDRLFRSNYRECKHAKVVRLYVQLRSADESATLVVRCLLCGKRL